MGGQVFSYSATQYGSWEKIYNADGTVDMLIYSKVAATAKTPYYIIADEYGPCNLALTNAAIYGYIGVPYADYDAATKFARFQIGGLCEDVITASLSTAVGHALNITSGAVADSGADYTGIVAQFGVCVTATTSSATHDIMLVPERILAN
jgi:hypothetical protein